MKLQFPIRFKIVSLLFVALTASLLSYIWVGTHLIVEDKISYIYDYTLAEVKAASDKVDSQLQRISSVGRMVGNMIRDLPAPPAVGPSIQPPAIEPAAAAKGLYEQYAKELGVTGALVLSAVDKDHFKTQLELGDGGAPAAAHYSTALAQLGWTPQAFEKEALLVGAPIQLAGAPPRVPVGIRTTSGDGKPLAFFTLCKLDQVFSQEGGKNYEIRLIDAFGKTLVAKPATAGALAPGDFDTFASSMTQTTFESGVRDWNNQGKDYIAGYQKLASKKLTVVSLISKDTAFAAAKHLIFRSVVLGASILLVALGATLLLVRSMTSRLREMWAATQKVSEGDFTIRVNTKKLPRDEVGGLATSFNAMADRINELMLQTAQKARMEKELETAQAVQSLFFPSKSFSHASFMLSGRYMPASECAGDWWHYAQIGSQLLVVVGDVTGHGVSAALVTAAAHSTFVLLVKQFSAKPDQEIPLEALVSALNSSVLAAAGGQSTMTFVTSVIDLKTGMMTMSNASHPPLYVYRKPPGADAGGNPLSNFKPIMDGRIAPLGDSPEIEFKSTRYQLQPGDRVFWYTDGIMESRPSDGEKLNKSAFLKLLASKSDGDSNEICGGVMDEAMKFFGSGSLDRPDDITLVVASIPADAKFVAPAAPTVRVA